MLNRATNCWVAVAETTCWYEGNTDLQFRMEEERRIMFPIIGNHSYEIMHGRGAPSRVYHAMENVAKSKGRAHGRKNVHDMLQWRSFAVPDDTNRNYFRSIHQGPTYLNFRTARTLNIPNEKKNFFIVILFSNLQHNNDNNFMITLWLTWHSIFREKV